MSDGEEAAKGKKRLLNNALRGDGVKDTFRQVEEDSFQFTDETGQPRTLSGAELQAQLPVIARKGWKGEVPVLNSDGSVGVGSLDNAKNMTDEQLAAVRVAHGNPGRGAFYSVADQTVNNDIDAESGFVAGREAMIRTLTFGRLEETPTTIALNQKRAELKPYSTFAGNMAGGLPLAAAATATGGALLPEAVAGTFTGELGLDLAVTALSEGQFSAADHALQNKELTGQSWAAQTATSVLHDLPFVGAFHIPGAIRAAKGAGFLTNGVERNSIAEVVHDVNQGAKAVSEATDPDELRKLVPTMENAGTKTAEDWAQVDQTYSGSTADIKKMFPDPNLPPAKVAELATRGADVAGARIGSEGVILNELASKEVGGAIHKQGLEEISALNPKEIEAALPQTSNAILGQLDELDKVGHFPTEGDKSALLESKKALIGTYDQINGTGAYEYRQALPKYERDLAAYTKAQAEYAPANYQKLTNRVKALENDITHQQNLAAKAEQNIPLTEAKYVELNNRVTPGGDAGQAQLHVTHTGNLASKAKQNIDLIEAKYAELDARPTSGLSHEEAQLRREQLAALRESHSVATTSYKKAVDAAEEAKRSLRTVETLAEDQVRLRLEKLAALREAKDVAKTAHQQALDRVQATRDNLLSAKRAVEMAEVFKGIKPPVKPLPPKPVKYDAKYLVDHLNESADKVRDAVRVASNGPGKEALFRTEQALRDMKHSDDLLGKTVAEAARISDEHSHIMAGLTEDFKSLKRGAKEDPISTWQRELRGQDAPKKLVSLFENIEKMEATTKKLASSPSKIHQEHAAKMLKSLDAMKQEVIASGLLDGTPGWLRHRAQWTLFERAVEKESAKRGAVAAVGGAVSTGAYLSGHPIVGVLSRWATRPGPTKVAGFYADGTPARVAMFGKSSAAVRQVFNHIAEGTRKIGLVAAGKKIGVAPSAVSSGMNAFRSYSSEKDKRKDFATLAKEMAHVTADPDYLISRLGPAVEPLVSFDRDAGQAASDTWVRKAMYLGDTLPTPPMSSSGKPRYEEMSTDAIDRYLLVAHTLDNPTDLVHEVAYGTIEKEQVDAVKTVHPALYNEMVGSVLEELGKHEEIPYNLQRSVSTLLGFPFDPAIGPAFTLDMQDMGVAAAAIQQQQPQPQAQGNGNSGRPLGKSFVTGTTRGANF